jgi:hypothetical protein
VAGFNSLVGVSVAPEADPIPDYMPLADCKGRRHDQTAIETINLVSLSIRYVNSRRSNTWSAFDDLDS